MATTDYADSTGPLPEDTQNKYMGVLRLKAVLEANIRQSIGYVGGETSEDRRRAMEYYLGEGFGNEIDGRSQVVSTDVQDAVEAMMPALMEIFASSDTLVEISPVGPEDQEFAKQATTYINHIWMKDNPGYAIIHDWVKDALLQKNGVIKIFWDDQQQLRRESFQNLNILALQQLMDDPEVKKVVEAEQIPAPPGYMDYSGDGMVYNVVVLREYKAGRVKIMSVAPEEFLISRRSLAIDDAEFTCHKCKKTISDLIEMGYDEEVVRNLPSHDEQDYNEERVARYNKDDEWPDWDTNLDPTMREVWLYDCYMKVDFNGDGIAEMRQVVSAGEGYEILSNEEIDEHPFVDITFIQMPHKYFGRSLADLTEDIQLIKSTIEREMLTNFYGINNNRHAVNDRVDLESWLNNSAGTPALVEGERPAGEAIFPITTQPLGPIAQNLLEYFDISREERTGITRLDQGMDPDSLNKTATGINLLLGRTQQRMLFTARTMANRGFMKAAKKILKILIQHQDFPRLVRMRGEFVPMDPSHWNSDMDVTVRVGLGAGTREQKLGQVQMIGAAQEKLIELQGGANGPFVTPKNIYNSAEHLVAAAGMPDARLFFNEPTKEQIAQLSQGRDPEMEKIQGQLQLDAQKAQAEMQIKRETAQADIQLEREKAAAELALEREKASGQLQLDFQKVGIDREKAAADVQLRQESNILDFEAKKAKIGEDARLAGEKQTMEGLAEGSIPDALMTKEKVEEMRDEVLAAMQQMAQATEAMGQVAQSIAQMTQVIAAPTRLIKDENGRPVGAEKVVSSG